MSTTTVTNAAVTLVAAGTSNAAAGTTRSTPYSLVGKLGGIVTMKIINGGTGPTLQCEGRVLIAHNATTPSAGSAGADWKTLWVFGGGTTLNAITEQSWEFGPGVMQLEIEFTGNTVQPVTVEAYLSEVTNSVTA
jgi:hypothetical protein